MPNITIEVTQKDINEGKAFQSHQCPVALAISRKMRIFGVDREIVFIDYFEPTPLPDIACKFISDFDEGKPVQPFSFVLTV